MANEYDALIAGETKTNLRTSMAQAAESAPDAEAEIRRLGRVYGLPTATVRNHLPEVKKRAAADSFDYDTLVAQAPRTAGYLADPENAKIAHDDVDSLSGIEQFIANLGSLGKASGLGLVEGALGAAEGLRDSYIDAASLLAFTPEQKAAFARLQKPSPITTARQTTRKRVEAFMPETTNAWEAGVNSGVVSLFQQAPMMVASVVTRNPNLALAGMGAQVGGQSFGQAKDAGKGTGEALGFAANQAAIEVLTERLPIGALIGDVAKGTGILQTLTKQLALEIPGEQLATAFQDLNEWAVLNPDKPFGDYLRERPNAALQTLVATVVGSGGMVAVGKIAGAAGGLDRKRKEAEGATAQAEALAEMEKLAAASKLRERDPQSFQDFIAAATEDGPVSDVYVSAEGLAQSGVDLEALAATLPMVAEQLQDALASGGDVRIPVDEFATHLAGDSMAKALLPYLKTDPGGFSQTEAKEFMATEGPKLQAEVEGVLAKSVEREAFQASTEKVQSYFLDQLNTAKRFSSDVNSAYATMMGSFYAVNAERLGVTPEEMLARYPLRIRAEGVVGGTRSSLLDQLQNRAIAGNAQAVEGNDQTVVAQSLVDSARATGVQQLSDIFVGETLGAEADGLGRTPSLLSVIAKVRAAADVDPQIFDAIIEAVPVDVVDGLFGSKRAAKMALNNEPMFEDGATVDAELPVSGAAEATDAVGLLLREAARATAERGGVALDARGETPKGRTASGAVEGDSLSQGKSSGPRATFNPSTSTITLLPKADLSSLLHELGHFYLETLADMASQPDAPAEIAADMETVLKWFGTMQAPEASGSGPRAFNQFAGEQAIGFPAEALERARQMEGDGELAGDITDETGWFRGDDGRWRFEISDHDAVVRPDAKERLGAAAMAGGVGKLSDVLDHPRLFAAYPALADTKVTNLDDLKASGAVASMPDGSVILLVNTTALERQDGKLRKILLHEVQHLIQYVEGFAVGASADPDALRAAGYGEVLNREITGLNVDRPQMSRQENSRTAAYRIYKRSAGEIEARNTEGRADMTPEERRELPQAWTRDIQPDQSIVRFEAAAKGFEQQGEDQGAPADGPMTLERWRSMTLDQQRFYHEAFARGFEAYLFEGKVPSNALRGVFQRFAAWLRNIYRDITRLKVDLTDDVRGVFDRMLASAAQIEEQAAADSIVPMFQSAEEAGMTPEAFADYRNEATAAMATAMDELQTRSLRDMKWLSGAKDKVLRRLQREAAEARKAIKAEVTEEVMAEPINRARTFLKRGIGADGQPVEGPHKLSLPALRTAHEGIPEELHDYKRLGYGRYGMLAEEGLDPDMVAESFGLPSGEALVEALLNAEPAAEKIAGMTDQRMLERYGDLTDDDAIERAADQALHNNARLKFVATEANALATAAGRPRVLAKAAKDYAAAMIGRLRVKDVKPYRYRAAETRAAQAAEKARKAGDLVTATVQKRNQLINGYATRAAYDTQTEIDKALNAWRRIVTGNDEALARNRDMDLVNAARAVLAVYGVGRKKNDVSGYIATLKRLNPALYDDIEPFLTRAAVNATPWQDITVEEFQGLRDTVNQLWFLSKRNRQMEVDGQLVDRKAVAAELSAKLDERGVPDVRPGEAEAVTDGQRVLRALSGFRAAARRVESWVRKIDAADTGPFRKYLWQPISETADSYLLAQKDYLNRFLALTQALGPIKAVKIAAPEIGYTFGDKGQVLHAILHTGNESNKRKLLLGRGWATETAEGQLDTQRWDAFIARMHAEGRLTKADYDFAQGVWDLLDETKDGAQRAHRAVYGRYFSEITAEPFDTPFGQYRGGYVPALTDQFLVQDAALRAQQDALTEGDAQMFPSPAKGFTKSRVDYNKQLALDLRLIPQHIDKVLKFTYFAAPSQDAVRLLKEKGLSAKLEAYDPVAQTDMLLPWLNRAAKQIVETPMPMGAAGKAAGTFFRTVRQRTGMGIMFANLTNSLQQLTGFSVATVRVRPGLLASNLWRYVQNPTEMAQAMREVSPFMAGRQDSQIFEMRQMIDDLLLDPTTFKTAQQFASRHGYFMQTAFQNVVDTVTWNAAREQAVERGETEAQAIRFANSVVRETQGGMRPEDIARFETGNAFERLFTQFAGFFNMMANLQGTEFSIAAQTMGLRKGAGRMVYVYAMGFAAPAVLSELIVQAMRGTLAGDDGEEGYLDDLLGLFFGSQVRFGLAMVPVAGQVLATGMNFWNDKPYDDRLSTPVISSVESAVKAPKSVYDAIANEGDKSRAFKDTLSLMTLMTGIPFTVLGRPGGYLVDMAEGDVAPTNVVDFGRGLVSGAASPESRE